MRSRRIAPAFRVAWLIVALAGFVSRVSAEDAPPDLDSLVAPIALYPDALVAEVLPASTYPVQVVEAARAVANGGHVDATQLSQWDPSVQALVGFPSVLSMMNDRLEWTTQLGEAVADDQGAVLAAVQRVRGEARKAGNLQTNDKQTVVEQDGTIVVQPTDPQVVYVPQYDPVAILSPPPPWGYYPVAYGVVGFGPGFVYDPLGFYGIGWGFGPAFLGGEIIVVHDHDHHHDDHHGHYDHDGHGDGHWSRPVGNPWRPPPRQSVGHAGMPGGVRGGPGGGFGDHDGFPHSGGLPHPGSAGGIDRGGLPHVGTAGGVVPRGPIESAPSPPRGGGALDHVGGGGWNARGYSERGARSFGDGFGGGGWSHVGGGGFGRGGAGGGIQGGGFGGGGRGGGGGGGHR